MGAVADLWEAFGGLLGFSWGLWEAPWEPPGGLSEASWGVSWVPLGEFLGPYGGLGGKKRLMERLGVDLRSPTARPGGVLGSAWSPLGPFLAPSSSHLWRFTTKATKSRRCKENIVKRRSDWPSGGQLVARCGVQFGARCALGATCPRSSLRTTPAYPKQHSGRRFAERQGPGSPDPGPGKIPKPQNPLPGYM